MEAAIVLPIIIFVVITAVLIIMFFYSQMSERSKMHIALRSEAGILTEKTIYKHDFRGSNTGEEIYVKKNGFGGDLYGRKYLLMDHKGVLHKKGVFLIEGSCYAVDGVKYVRYCNFVKGLKDE